MRVGRSLVVVVVVAAAAAAVVGRVTATGTSRAPAAADAVVALPEAPATPDAGAPRYGTYAWPVDGPVVRRFEPPDTTFGPGHRGIDIAAPLGTSVVASASGVVAFAGPVAGGLFVSIDHPDGVRT